MESDTTDHTPLWAAKMLEEEFLYEGRLRDFEEEPEAPGDQPATNPTKTITINKPSRLQVAILGAAALSAGTAYYFQIELYCIAGGIGAGLLLIATLHALVKAKARKEARKPHFTEEKINYLRARYKARTEDNT